MNIRLFTEPPQALFQAAEIQDLYLGHYSDALLNYLLLERDYPDATEVDPARRQVAVLYKYRLNDCSSGDRGLPAGSRSGRP